jgi:hypothetical protein
MKIIPQSEDPKINLKIVIDPFINEQAKLSRAAFLERVRSVQSIRTTNLKIGFYLNDDKKLLQLTHLHQIVNVGKFNGQTLTPHRLFAIGIPQKLFSWVSNTSLATFKQQLLHWHAAYYTFNPFQEFADEELDPLVLAEVNEIIIKFYPENYREKFNVANIDNNEERKEKMDFALKYYNDVSIQYTGSHPPEFLKNPYQDPFWNIEENDYDWGLSRKCQFTIRISCFSRLDWIVKVERSIDKLKDFYKLDLRKGRKTIQEIEAMIENADDDNLQRAESDDEMWQKWKYTFQNYEISKEFIYDSLIPREESKTGYVYLMQDESGATKIGWTKKEEIDRISGVQTGNPTNISIRGSFKASSSKTEKVLHKLYKSKRIRERGEWFFLTEEDIQNILDTEWRRRNNIY